MSHQATFVGHYQEAADLARAGIVGLASDGTPTLRAQFLAMEARALARLGDARGCDLALAAAVTEFERRRSDDDPEWIRYFADAELAAEFCHCYRDLARPDAVTYALDSLAGDVGSPRSDFFVSMVLADAYAAGGEIEEARRVAAEAFDAAANISSLRTTDYVREFRTRLGAVASGSVQREIDEQFAYFLQWQGAGPRKT
jgi:hypothetical protein